MTVQLTLLYDGISLSAALTGAERDAFVVIAASDLRTPTPVNDGAEVPVSEPIDPEALLGFSIEEVEETRLVLLSGVVHESLYLPFSERRKVAQIAPVQLQDSFPFDFEEFVLDVEPTGFKHDGENLCIAGLCSKAILTDALLLCRTLGVEPRRVSSAASILSAVPAIEPEAGNGVTAAVFLRQHGTSTALFVDGTPVFLRDSAQTDFKKAILEARLALEKGATTVGKKVERVYLVGGDGRPAEELAKVLGAPSSQLYLNDKTLRSPEEECLALASVHLEKRCWGLQFRKGEFAYRASFRQVVSGLGDELPYLIWAVAMLVLWGVTEIGGSLARLGEVNSRISALVTSVLPTEELPSGSERRILSDRLATIEGELQRLGSLSKISPLESLRGLSESVAPELGLSIEALSVAQAKMVFNGTVADTPAVGRLSSALERREGVFCDVQISPKGKLPGSSRARFSAELVFCE